MKDLKLKIELVPRPAHYGSLREKVERSVWEKIRKETKERQGNKCGICGDQEHRLECHEIWEYDDSRFIYTLVGFISLCGYCHKVKHMGLTQNQAAEGRVDLEAVIDHFCKVNDCTEAEYREHKTLAFAEWHARNEYKWEPDFGEYASLVKIETKKS